MITKMKDLYWASPEIAKDMIGWCLRLLPNDPIAKPTPAQKDYHSKLLASEWLPADQLKQIQLDKLSKMIRHAYEHTRYYRSVFEERKLKPSDIKTIEDLQKLPILTKEIIRSRLDDFICDTVTDRSQLEVILTGGSTGTPMRFFFDKHMLGVRNAHWWRWSDFAGIKLFEDKMIYCGGAPKRWVNAPENTRGCLSLTRNRLSISSANMSDKVLDWYIEDISKFKGDYIRGYASGVYLLARRLVERGITIPLKAILTSSDTLFPQYRATIEKAFRCQVFNHYGQNEDSLTANECSKGDGFHINVESCVVESVDNDGLSVTGREGRLLSTHLENFVMPLIRYAVGDVGIVSEFGPKCNCGRSHQKLLSLTGRDDDIIVTPEGFRVGCGSMNQPMKTMYDSIKSAQYIQEDIGLLHVKVIPTERWDNSIHYPELEHNIRKHVGKEIKIEIELVDDIPRRPNGKYQFIVSKIPQNATCQRQ
ncbi:MAG: hypothetical protein AB1847_18555 [bacterium]